MTADNAIVPDPSRRRRGGRPALPPDARRGHPVTFWVTPDELARLDIRANAAGLSVSAYLRAAAIEADSAPATRRRRAGPDIGAVIAQLGRLGNNLNQVVREAHSGPFPPSSVAAAEDAIQALAAYLRRLAAADHDPET